MTKPVMISCWAGLALLTATAVTQGSAVDVRASMQRGINPAMLSIWEVTNEVVSEDGGIDPTLMNDAKWAQIEAGADQLVLAADALAKGSIFIAAAPENFSVTAGEVPMAEIQKYLDRDPQEFAKLASDLVDHGDKLAAAARAKDATTAGRLVGELDGVCEGCHARYWYPE